MGCFRPATGTPQGGIIPTVLANVYLHYCLDLWFHKVVRMAALDVFRVLGELQDEHPE